MSTVIFLTDGPDATAEAFASAARTHGHDVRVIPVDRHRLELHVDDAVRVTVDGTDLLPDVVVNRCSANPSGLPSVAALRRQPLAGWADRFAGAREEQGLLLAVFDAWEILGVEVINPPIVEARSLMGHWLAVELAKRGMPFGSRVDTTVAVIGGRIAIRPGQDHLPASASAAARAVADIAGAQMADVDLEIDGDAVRPVGWRPNIDLHDRGDSTSLAGPMIAHLLGESESSERAARPTLFVEDLVSNVESPPTA